MKKKHKTTRELCSEIIGIDLHGSAPGRPAIHMTTVYECDSPSDADRKLGGELAGYVYQRDGHPNADLLAERCRRLHDADQAVVTSSGMSATSLCMLATLSAGDHVLLSDRLYGRTTTLVRTELSRFGISFSTVDTQDLDAVSQVLSSQPDVKMLVVETISNPMLHVAPIADLAGLAKSHGVLLVVDNTFASPIICQPLKHGADFVIESMTKIMNGHGDVTMGLLAGRDSVWERVPGALASFGMTTSPFACWLADRGLATLFVRMAAASRTALGLAKRLSGDERLVKVCYPGLEPSIPSKTLFEDADNESEIMYGSMLTIELKGDGDVATEFIQRLAEVPYCPTLGDYATSLSHPCSSSHRSLDAKERERLGFNPNTIRFSVGLEGEEFLFGAIDQALSS